MLIALLATSALAPVTLNLKIVTASLFKNGYAVVVREAPLPRGGEYQVEELPPAVLGTFWITASKGVKLREVVATNLETQTEADASSLEEVLRANVGKTMKFWLVNKPDLTGKLESCNGSILVITSESETRVIARSDVVQVSSAAGELVWKVKRPGTKRVMRLRADSPDDGKLYVVSLEKGATWSPAYSVDISDPKKLELVSKGIILNDTLDLGNIEVRLITGFPNIPFLNYWDPFAVAQSVDQFTGALMQMGTPQQFRREMGRALMQNAAPAPASFADAFEMSPVPGFAAEDLFFYRQPNVTLKKGDRGYYVLFTFDSEYAHVYEWDIPDRINETQYVDSDDKPGDVWHSIKFKNNGGNPLTTGPATIFKSGDILGQDMMNYAGPGAEVSVRMSKALDVRAEDAEEETGREHNNQVIRGSYYDLVTLKGTLRIQNRKGEAIKLKITKDLTGEVISADGKPTIKAVGKGLRAVNPHQKIEWTVSMKGGESAVIGYSYKVYINR
jgi:hypothetical protein